MDNKLLPKVVPMQVGNLELMSDAYVLNLDRINVILRVALLKTWGKVTVDWREMTMSFYWGSNTI